MIIHKLARIGSKEDGYKLLDELKNIAGYAKLIYDYLENQPGMIKTLVAYKKTN